MNETSEADTIDRLTAIADARMDWKWDQVRIADRPFRLAVAADPDAMLIEACRRQDAGEQGVIDPFWATTWRAAAGLDRYLDRLDLHGTRVLELGCGTGHAGIAAALRGARVTLTDGVEDPLLLVKMSAWPIREACEIRRLRFGVDKIETPRFPLILGSDVTYLRTLWPELEKCFDDHLADDGQVLLSDPYRIIANEYRQWLDRRDWNYQEHRVQMDDDPEHPIRVMRLTRNAQTKSPDRSAGR